MRISNRIGPDYILLSELRNRLNESLLFVWLQCLAFSNSFEYFFKQQVTVVSEDAYSIFGGPRPRDDAYNQQCTGRVLNKTIRLSISRIGIRQLVTSHMHLMCQFVGKHLPSQFNHGTLWCQVKIQYMHESCVRTGYWTSAANMVKTMVFFNTMGDSL
jgi:hypothetical protein